MENAYTYTNSKGVVYYLHSKRVQLRGGERQIHYFSRSRTSFATDTLPAGYVVVESKRTGLPVLKKA